MDKIMVQSETSSWKMFIYLGKFYSTQYSKIRQWSTSQIKPSVMEGHYRLLTLAHVSVNREKKRSPASSPPSQDAAAAGRFLPRTPPLRVFSTPPCPALSPLPSSSPCLAGLRRGLTHPCPAPRRRRLSTPCSAPRRHRSTPPFPAARLRRSTHVRLAVGSPPLGRHRPAAGRPLPDPYQVPRRHRSAHVRLAVGAPPLGRHRSSIRRRHIVPPERFVAIWWDMVTYVLYVVT
jgi:hypothetical protein